MSLPSCSSCGLPCADVVVLEHKRKGEAKPTEWSIGRCCWSDRKPVAVLGQGGETTKQGK